MQRDVSGQMIIITRTHIDMRDREKESEKDRERLKHVTF